MENKNFNLPLTNQALAEFSATAARLEAALKAKQAELRTERENSRAEHAQKAQSLGNLQETAAAVLQNMDGIISQIDNVLENNGSSNNNN